MDHVDFDFGKSGSLVFQFSKVAGEKTRATTNEVERNEDWLVWRRL